MQVRGKEPRTLHCPHSGKLRGNPTLLQRRGWTLQPDAMDLSLRVKRQVTSLLWASVSSFIPQENNPQLVELSMRQE
jgi:hypothetical protein